MMELAVLLNTIGFIIIYLLNRRLEMFIRDRDQVVLSSASHKLVQWLSFLVLLFINAILNGLTGFLTILLVGFLLWLLYERIYSYFFRQTITIYGTYTLEQIKEPLIRFLQERGITAFVEKRFSAEDSALVFESSTADIHIRVARKGEEKDEDHPAYKVIFIHFRKIPLDRLAIQELAERYRQEVTTPVQRWTSR
jgi:hypothetical protein